MKILVITAVQDSYVTQLVDGEYTNVLYTKVYTECQQNLWQTKKVLQEKPLVPRGDRGKSNCILLYNYQKSLLSVSFNNLPNRIALMVITIIFKWAQDMTTPFIIPCMKIQSMLKQTFMSFLNLKVVILIFFIKKNQIYLKIKNLSLLLFSFLKLKQNKTVS